MTPINIAILAMGGEGGGVLADWLVHVGEQNNYLAQTTSVPGVAQRTGATVYYLELFPRSALSDGQSPVLGLMPMPGDIDLVVASELMEAGRAIQRGLVTPDRTHFVASTHRVYSMTEKIALADGRIDAPAIVEACTTAALKFTGFDMARLAEANRSVISAVLFGAIAGSDALPFARADFEEAIRAGGVSVKASLAAFASGYAAGRGDGEITDAELSPAVTDEPSAMIPDHVEGEALELIKAGLARTADYQDQRYAQDYLDRLGPFLAVAERSGDAGNALLGEVARQLALGMTYEDTVRVAELKIRASRFARVREEVGADHDQIVEIVEFMHPRIEEIADTMPAAIGRWLLRSTAAKAVLKPLTSRGRMVRTTSLRGFLMLYVVASLKPWRRGSLRYRRETEFLTRWLKSVQNAAVVDMATALSMARLRNLVKGYGDTYERGLSKYETIHAFISADLESPTLAADTDTLIAAAEKDEGGAALRTEIGRLATTRDTRKIANNKNTHDAAAS